MPERELDESVAELPVICPLPFNSEHLEPGAIQSAEQITNEEWLNVLANLESDQPAYNIDWQNLPPVEQTAERLQVLAEIKVLVPKDNPENQKNYHNITIENHLKMFLEMAGSRDNLAIFFALALERLKRPDETAIELAQQAFWIWAPAAEILGWSNWQNDLEEEAFKALLPGEHAKIGALFDGLGGKDLLDQKMAGYITEIKEEGLEIELPSELVRRCKVFGRCKSDYSVWCKFLRKTDISDFIGLRIVIEPPDSGKYSEEIAEAECYYVRDVVHQLYEAVPDRIKDYIGYPNERGYRSLHTIVKDEADNEFEVQIRTTAMHKNMPRRGRSTTYKPRGGQSGTSHIAYDASVKYTPGKYQPPHLEGKNRIYHWRDRVAAELQQRENELLKGLCPDEVLVFTPEGNLHSLPAGATMLDFAFVVNSDRALRTERFCMPKTANLAKYGHRPQYGDCVEVQCAPTMKCKESWLKTAQVPRTRHKIKNALKRQQSADLIENALGMISKAFDVPFPLNLLTEQDRERLTRSYGLIKFDHVLREIGAGAEPGKLLYAIAQKLKQPSAVSVGRR